MRTSAPAPPPLAAGRAAPRRRRDPLTPSLLVAAVGLLCLIGLVMVLSSSSVDALRRYGSAWLFFKRQLLWLAAGWVALVVASRIDYRRWRVVAVPLLVGSLLLLGLVLVPGIGIRVSGSSRWLGVGGWRMQPSELTKLAVLLVCADLLARRVRPAAGLRVTRPVLLVLLVVVALVMAQPDMGTTLVLGAIVFALLHVAGTPLRRMAALVTVAAVSAFALGMAAPYRRARMLSFVDPWKDPANTGYQVAQSLVGLASGGVAGVGLGASRAKWGFLPNAHTDFIFTILGEETGLLGAGLVVVLFAAFAVLGVRAALRAPDRFGMLLAAGVTAWVVAQAFINLGAVVGLLPVTGVPLPFLSFGGSSLVIALFAVGVLVNVAGQGRPGGCGPA